MPTALPLPQRERYDESTCSTPFDSPDGHSFAMTVRCAQCGEEMLGAVNRCWRCGNPVVANAAEPDLPPQRRLADAPAPVQTSHQGMVTEAELVDEEEPEERDPEQTISDHYVNGDTVIDAEPPVRESAPAQAASTPAIDAAKPYQHPVPGRFLVHRRRSAPLAGGSRLGGMGSIVEPSRDRDRRHAALLPGIVGERLHWSDRDV